MYDIWYVFYCSYTFYLRDSTTTSMIFYYIDLLTFVIGFIISIYYIWVDIFIITIIYFLIHTYY